MTEHNLLEQAQAGDRAAFRELVRANRPMVLAIAYDLTGSVDDAEDLAQEVFIKMFRSVASFRGDAKLSSWLYRVTVNTWISKARCSAERQRSQEDSFDTECNIVTKEYAASAGYNPEYTAEASMISTHIQGALKLLSPRERAVFTLRHFHDMKLAEVGKTLEISEGSVKSLLFRAVKKMKKHLAMYRPVKGSVL